MGRIKGSILGKLAKGAARLALPKGAEYALGLTKRPGAHGRRHKFSMNRAINKLIQAKLVAKRMSYKVKLANSVK